MDGGGVLLRVVVGLDALGSGVGLAGDAGVVSTMGLVDTDGDGGGVADLDGLVVGLVRGGDGQESGADECLKINVIIRCRVFSLSTSISSICPFRPPFLNSSLLPF